MKFLLFICVLITFFSCSDINKGEQLKVIETIQKSIDSVETVLIETSFDEVDRYFKEAKTVQSRIKENYNSDTISMDLAIKLDKYKNLVLKTPILQKSYFKIAIKLNLNVPKFSHGCQINYSMITNVRPSVCQL